ncbi:MAG TPA: glycosyltransferase family 2 protein [Candidatus Acidoferrales bacterium]|nr:glycosyltransferase family 2 protein [Candidatus Acidoferrales bacterium]
MLWIVLAIRAALGIPRLPQLRDTAPLADAECPSVSVIFAARDEEEKMPRALASMLAQDYPRYEVVAVNDRSRDATGRILAEAAAQNSYLKPVHIEELPPGWLGKPHALHRGFEKSSGEWLLFTDGDVKFAPDLVRRAMRVALANGWDHLTLMGNLEMRGFWEKTALLFFGLAFTLRFEPWKVSHPKSKQFMGGGVFQLVRRAAYEASGGHRRLAMEVVEDMKLGKIIKQAGFRSGVAVALEYVSLRWHAGLGNLIRGTEKNFFAAMEFSLTRVFGAVAGLLLISVLPFAALVFADGWALIFAGVAALVAVLSEGVAAYWFEMFPLYGLTHPLGALIFCWMIMRSTIATLWQGGIVWRGTFYPLTELRKGLV